MDSEQFYTKVLKTRYRNSHSIQQLSKFFSKLDNGSCLQVEENDSPCFSGSTPIWIDVRDNPYLLEAAIQRLKECTSMFSKTQKCILYDHNFDLLETVLTAWGDEETIQPLDYEKFKKMLELDTYEDIFTYCEQQMPSVANPIIPHPHTTLINKANGQKIMNFGKFSGCETDAVIFICTDWTPKISSSFLEPITRAKQFLAIISVLDGENTDWERNYEDLIAQLR